MGKTLDHDYCGNNIEAVFLKRGTTNVSHKNNYTPRAVATATLLVSVSFCQENPHLPTSDVTQRILLGTNIVPILS